MTKSFFLVGWKKPRRKEKRRTVGRNRIRWRKINVVVGSVWKDWVGDYTYANRWRQNGTHTHNCKIVLIDLSLRLHSLLNQSTLDNPSEASVFFYSILIYCFSLSGCAKIWNERSNLIQLISCPVHNVCHLNFKWNMSVLVSSIKKKNFFRNVSYKAKRTTVYILICWCPPRNIGCKLLYIERQTLN